MPDSTPSQSHQDAFISSNEPDQWSPENNANIIQNETGLEWNAVPNQHIVPVPSNVNQSFVSSGANEHELIRFNASTNYINIQYPSHVAHTNFPVGLHNAQPPVPVIVRPPHRPTLPQSWAAQQNLKLIQTAWNKNNGRVKKQKRVRTAFTSHQMMELEQEYARTRYLDRTRRIELADILRLNERTIKIWFQNRRMKEKKDRTENAEETEDVSTTQSSADLCVPMEDQYQPNGEGFNRMGVYIEQYPVSTTSMAPLPQVQMMAPGGSYSTYAVPMGCPPQYQQVHLQVQYPTYNEVQELSPDSVPKSERSVSVENNTQSDTEKSWDMAWIRGIKADDEC